MYHPVQPHLHRHCNGKYVRFLFRSSFRVGIRNQTVFRVIRILGFPDGIGFLFPSYQNGIRFTAIGKGILTGIVFGIFNCRYRYRQRTGHAGKLAHLVALLVINILDILCFFIFQTAFHLNEISLFIISLLDFFVLVTLDLLFCFHKVTGFIIFVYYGLVTGTSVCLVLRKFFFDFTQQKIIGIRFRHILIVFIHAKYNILALNMLHRIGYIYFPQPQANMVLVNKYSQSYFGAHYIIYRSFPFLSLFV